MGDWQKYLRLGRAQVARVPLFGWMVGGVIAVAFAVVASMEMSGPPYVALYDGLSPSDGGKVIAQLQKLGIPYELQAAGNVILVPAPQLAEARLQLGAAQVPGSDATTGWDKLENAPMTTSDLAQNALATRALEASLEQSIGTLAGIQSAQVYLAIPPDTAFLADQPKPTASVVVAGDDTAAQAQGAAIANLVAGAVPGLAAQQVTVETTSGVVVYPADNSMASGSQIQTVADVQNAATARIAALLAPIVGEGNFRTNVSANVDFTQTHIHQITYGPTQIVSHQTSAQTDRTGSLNADLGIPGALSNEPPAATTATAPPAPTAPANGQAAPAAPTAAAAPPAPPHDTSKNLDQTYVVDQSESDITKPNWTVNSIAISVVLNKAALGTTSTDQVKAAIAGAFAYPVVKVNVMVAPFQRQQAIGPSASSLLQAAGPISRALLEVIAALALLFGVALPGGRWLGSLSENIARAIAPPPPPPVRQLQVVTPPPDAFAELREKAAENPTSVARLLQGWAEENE
jgi:flagellar M-ring protein FliF